jgi:hypothetical protein
MSVPGGHPFGGMFSPRNSHSLGSSSILRGNNPFSNLNLIKNMNMGAPQSPSGPHDPSSSTQYFFSNMPFPFLATLNLLELLCLKNEPILHNLLWSAIPVKLPSYMSKFNGKPREDPPTHIMAYQLLCSSNSLMEDSVRLCLFHTFLTRDDAKWYVELKGSSFTSFNDLAMEFLTHFQLPIRYEIRE